MIYDQTTLRAVVLEAGTSESAGTSPRYTGRRAARRALDDPGSILAHRIDGIEFELGRALPVLHGSEGLELVVSLTGGIYHV